MRTEPRRKVSVPRPPALCFVTLFYRCEGGLAGEPLDRYADGEVVLWGAA